LVLFEAFFWPKTKLYPNEPLRNIFKQRQKQQQNPVTFWTARWAISPTDHFMIICIWE